MDIQIVRTLFSIKDVYLSFYSPISLNKMLQTDDKLGYAQVSTTGQLIFSSLPQIEGHGIVNRTNDEKICRYNSSKFKEERS